MITALKVSIVPLLLTCLLVFVALTYLYYNPSISEPLGYYLIVPGSEYKKGNTVLTCIDSEAHKAAVVHGKTALFALFSAILFAAFSSSSLAIASLTF